MNDSALEARIGRQEDLEAIKQLMAKYAFHANKGWGMLADAGRLAHEWRAAQDGRSRRRWPRLRRTLNDLQGSRWRGR